MPLILIFLKTIELHVRVPVLSEKIYETCPSSSLSPLYYTVADIPLFGLIRSASHSMKVA
jgi:hypothetical protein